MSFTALAAALATAASAGANLFGSHSQNKQNWQMAQNQMAFQREMSSTAHQREAEDLRAAGMNPIMTATGGSGASTPSGASANMISPMKDVSFDPMAIMAVEKVNADISKTKAETSVNWETAKNLQEQNKNLQEQNKNLGVQNILLQRQAEKVLVDMGYTRIQAAKILAEGHGYETIEGNIQPGPLTGLVVKGKVGGKSYIPSMTVENAMSRLPTDFYNNR